jgi:cytochrome P450
MSTPASPDVLRSRVTGPKAAISAWAMQQLPLVFRILRTVHPILRIGKTVVVTRYDDVREAFLNDAAFRVPYGPHLDVIMGHHPFFLSMDDTPEYRRDTDAMRKVVRISDIPQRLVPEVERLGEMIVAESNGSLEVVDSLVRRVTFELYSRYFGVTDPPGGDLRVWATRLFEFQFVDPENDPSLRAEVDKLAPALRDHIQNLMNARRTSGAGQDDVLGRCLVMQAQNVPGFSDDQIRSSLMGFIVGGPPQPPMVVPQALEQLLRRPDALEGAQRAARDDDNERLAGYVFEAMRFDPLAPFLPRTAIKAATIAAGTARSTDVPEGATLYISMSSAMMDDRRLADPQTFNPRRLPHEYIHFGYGLHQCFGFHMNTALLPLMLKSLLKRKNLRRAKGSKGKLRKRGVFSDTLYVDFD